MPSSAASGPSEDPFRQLFLQSVEENLADSPSFETLAMLLKLANPSFKRQQCSDDNLRERAFKSLKLRVHPDKHNNDQKATELFQRLQEWYRDAVRAGEQPSRKKGRKGEGRAPPPHLQLPGNFDVFQKWPFLNKDSLSADDFNVATVCNINCANLQAQVEHGRGLSVKDSLSPASLYSQERPIDTTKIKTLTDPSAEEIKLQIMKSGPVVSKSFRPSGSLLTQIRQSFPGAMRTHRWNDSSSVPVAVLITGWATKEYGEAWTLFFPGPQKPNLEENWPYDTSDIRGERGKTMAVGLHQYGVERQISFVDPSHLADIGWYSRPYFQLTPEQFQSGLRQRGGLFGNNVAPLFSVVLADMKDLNRFGSVMQSASEMGNARRETEHDGVAKAARDEKVLIELHAPGKKSASRTVMINDLAFNLQQQKWVASFKIPEPTSNPRGLFDLY
ncbi:unnamed protein product [Amoebophrya sp. A120]|nr:unnamed protein product [Amoebophrya sp. A120]|eukprot:GSA120T00005580001.1